MIAPPILVPAALTILLTGLYTARLLHLSATPRHDRMEGGRLVIVTTAVLALTALALAVLTANGGAAVALIALAGLAIGVALARGLIRVIVPTWLIGAARSGFEFEALYRASVVAAFEAAARSVESGTERVIGWAGDEVGLAAVRAGRWLDRAHGRYARAGEIVAIAAAVALVAYWGLR
jgi:hypothetical protein